MFKYHQVENVTVRHGILSLVVDGKPVQHGLRELSPVFAQATSEELGLFEVTPSGYGIHWPLLNEDISIDGLLGIAHSPNEAQKVA